MSKRIGVALIGCGYSGCDLHAVWYQKIPDLKFIVAVDTNIERARIAAERYGALAFSNNWRNILRNPEVDMVDINVPPSLNREIAVTAAEAGKHILCEKPMAVSLKDADSMISESEKNHVKLMVGHVLHFFPEYVAVKKALQQNIIGRVHAGIALRWLGEPYFPFSSTWNKWYGSPDLGGGVTFSMQIHDIDILKSLFGKVKEVSSIIRNFTHPEFSIDDFSTTTLFFDDEKMATAGSSWVSPSPFTQQLELFGEEGHLHLRSGGRLTSIKGLQGESPVKAYFKDGSMENLIFKDINGYYAEIKHFITCIKNDNPPLLNPYDSRETLKIVLSALDSAKSGKKIKISER